MRQNPHVRICGGPGSATTLVYPTHAKRSDSLPEERRQRAFPRFPLIDDGVPGGADQARQSKLAEIEVSAECASIYSRIASRSTIWAIRVFICSTAVTVVRDVYK